MTGGHGHILHELGHILDHAAWLQVQIFSQLCSGMLAAKWSSPMHVVTRKKDPKMPLATATPCLYSIAMNSRPFLPLYDHVDSNQWWQYIISIYLFKEIE